MRHALALASLSLLLACGDDANPTPDGGGDLCVVDSDCDDGIYCNGAESCRPASTDADGRGCVNPSDRCLAGQECSESEMRCVTVDCTNADADGDGLDSIDCGGTDCDDGDAERYPGNTEICDTTGHDEDCDPATVGPDEDEDGFAPLECCNGARCGLDCDDALGGVSPDAVEACNGVDEDCDGTLDEGATELYFRDLDGDGFGDPSTGVMRACVEDPLFTRQADDCDDRDPATNPGADEVCDGLDNDCNAGTPYDRDGDGDGHLPVDAACEGGVLPKDDCDDANPFANGGAAERCSGIDDDCDGAVDEAAADVWCTDQTGDPSASALCGPGGTCVLAGCGVGRADCDGVIGTGCETDLTTDPNSCGACGATCPSGTCADGLCVLDTGTTQPTFTTMRSKDDATCALTTDGNAVCWGQVLPFESHRRPAALRDASGPIPNIADVGLGEECLCYLTEAGAILCMGATDRAGEPSLCDGTGRSEAFVVDPTPLLDTDGSSPVTDATAMAVSNHSGCFIRASVTVSGSTYSDVVYCWGANPLGDGTTDGSNTPQLVLRDNGLPLDGVSELSAGERSYCAIAGGQVLCWGEYPVADRWDYAVPVNGPGAVALTADSVHAGARHACALSGTDLYCWGDNTNYPVSTSAPASTLTQAVVVAGSWAAVAPATREGDRSPHTCGMRTTGELECWGSSAAASLSSPTEGTGCDDNIPCEVHSHPHFFQKSLSVLTASNGYSCVLADGWPWCWGDAADGRIGVPYQSFRAVDPVPLPDFGVPAEVEVSTFGGCARTTTGRVSCWGSDRLTGVLGLVDGYDVAMPMTGLPAALDIGVGESNVCIVGTDQQVHCWGTVAPAFGADAGFLGGATELTPDVAHTITGVDQVVELAMADHHACVLRADSTVWCWGASDTGATGEVGSTACGTHQCTPTPREVSGLPGTPVQLVTGGLRFLDEPGFSCARLSDGRVACWGSNTLGALGDGTSVDSVAPVLVAGVDDAVELVAGDLHVCAVRSNGELTCWGADVGGTLGTTQLLEGCGFAACTRQSVRATSLRGVELLSAGLNRTCASTTTGSTYCWGGRGFTGGLTQTGPAPALVQDITFPRALASGYDVSCALTLDALLCWGYDESALLADGTDDIGVDVLTPRYTIGF